MTIDERLDRLTERHEALVDVLASAEVRQVASDVRELAAIVKDGFAGINQSIALLLQVAQNHESRLGRLEGGK